MMRLRKSHIFKVATLLCFELSLGYWFICFRYSETAHAQIIFLFLHSYLLYSSFNKMNLRMLRTTAYKVLLSMIGSAAGNMSLWYVWPATEPITVSRTCFVARLLSANTSSYSLIAVIHAVFLSDLPCTSDSSKDPHGMKRASPCTSGI